MKSVFVTIILLLIITAILVASSRYMEKTVITQLNQDQILNQNIDNQSQTSQGSQNNASQIQNSKKSFFVAPLGMAKQRVTKKPFGIFVSAQNSPVQPERFRGFHTGTDFEIFPEELDVDISVKAVCSGKLLAKKYAGGYGGVMVEACELKGEPITVVYGHLKLSSIPQQSGDDINAGDVIGILGADKSQETDGERKHLHLGFHRGNRVDIRGYVPSPSLLGAWIDPCIEICSN